MTGEQKGSQIGYGACSYYDKWVDRQNLKHCRRPLYRDKRCIFHSDDIEGKKNEFEKAFWNEFERQMNSEEIYNFSGFVFPGVISFESMVFEKDAYFGYAVFSRDTCFRDSKFARKANFWQAHFAGEVIFYKAIFNGFAQFGQAKFDLNAYLEHAKFKGDVNFRLAEFAGKAYFKNDQFSKTSCFMDSQFSKEVFFNNAHFEGDVNFQLAEFAGKAYFKYDRFYKKVCFKKTQFSKEVYLNNAKFRKADFTAAKFKDDAEFINMKIKKCSNLSMIDTYFYNVSGLFEFIEKNDIAFKKLKKISNTLTTEFLPKNFRLILGEGVRARYQVQSRQIKDDMYLLDKKERISNMSGMRKFLNTSLFFLWWLFSDYGRSFKRWAIWSMGIALLFALIFCQPPGFFPDWWIDTCNKIGPCFEQTADAYKGEPLGFWSSLYFSIVTFTTLGFGDVITANTAARIFVTIEVMLGYIMLGGLISILANKLARRS